MELPELWKGDPQKKADVNICLSEVPEKLEGCVKKGIGYQIKPEHYILSISGVARYMVIKGEEIRLEIEKDAHLDEVKVFLYASVFGALSHLRGALPLHASAIKYNKRIILFAGNTGAGKSTIAAAFQKKGFEVLSDDLVPVFFSPEKKPITSKGIARMKLWAEALEKMNISYNGKSKIRGEIEKYHVPVQAKEEPDSSFISTLFVLEPYPGKDIELIDVRGRERLSYLINNTFRYQLLEGFGLKEWHFTMCTQLLKHIQLIRVRQPRAEYKLEELVTAVEQRLEA